MLRLAVLRGGITALARRPAFLIGFETTIRKERIKMKIKYRSATGAYSIEVDVTEELGEFIMTSDDELRKDDRNYAKHHKSLTGFVYEDERFFTDPADGIEQYADRAALEEAMGRLSEGQRRLVERVYLEGWTIADIACAERVTHEAVRRRLERANKKIKSFFR
jgi:RNA polymerase sigma factor (sigma-70 family)